MSADQHGIRILGPTDGDILVEADGSHDRFLVPSTRSGGGFALVEHVLAPRRLAAPLHRHSVEDEYTFVLEGRVGAELAGEHATVDAGFLLYKPRGQWHTFWNAGDSPCRMLEIISPGGFEECFRQLAALDGEPTPEAMIEIAGGYGVELDFEATVPIVERHGLSF
jgi:mannose-6-phosphate isomerase-like protein (cupin superfamily)